MPHRGEQGVPVRLRLTPYEGDGGQATAAFLAGPAGVAVGPDGSVYIADTGNSAIRRVGTDGVITTFVGGLEGFAGDAGPAANADLSQPRGVAVGPGLNLFIADTKNNRIRRVDLPVPWFADGNIARTREERLSQGGVLELIGCVSTVKRERLFPGC